HYSKLISGEIYRIDSIFVTPNMFSFFLLIILFVTIYKAQKTKKNIFKKTFYSLFICLIILLIYETKTRSTWIVLIIAVFLYNILRKNKLMLIINLILTLYLI
ncbi:hypothetical protein JDF658_22880, partial [Carboxydocella sp. JDF658]